MIKRLNKTEILNALPLVWDVFCEFEAPNYPEPGKKMFWDALIDVCQADFITVHASLYAVPIYEKLGFVCAGNEVDDNGIKYVPMVFNNAGTG